LRACGLAVAILLTLASGAFAQTCTYFDSFKDNADGTFSDPRDGLIWSRCAVGQTWNGAQCDGKPNWLNWWDAMRAAKAARLLEKTDWRLPSPSELQEVGIGHRSKVFCHRGDRMVSIFFDSQAGNVWTYKMNPPPHGQKGTGYYGGLSRASNPGHIMGLDLDSRLHVWLVRGGQSNSYEEFSSAFSQVEKNDIRLQQALKEESQRQATRDRERGEYEAQRAKEEAIFNTLLRSHNPRMMYLSAVQLEDSGDRGKAKTVYRELMKRFPNAQETLLASQRLTRLGDVEAVESSNSNAAANTRSAADVVRTQNYEQCQNERNACYQRCGQLRGVAESRCTAGCAICSR
jgi:hypothetical protein